MTVANFLNHVWVHLMDNHGYELQGDNANTLAMWHSNKKLDAAQLV
jgi:hypothetical protein